MKNLSEKIGYFDTAAVERYTKNYEANYGTDNPYYIRIKEIVAKQKNNEIVTDEEYRSIPVCGIPDYWSAAEGYYTVNFHYSFYDPAYRRSAELLYKFMDFLSAVNFALCRETEVYNWLVSFRMWTACIDQRRPDLKDKCDFVERILEAVDPMKRNGIDSLLGIDRSVAPDVFDNAALYFRTKDKIYAALEQQYADAKSLKAKDVMEILDISRRTLSRYVEAGTVLIDSTINGRYKYNKESVFKLLRHGKTN